MEEDILASGLPLQFGKSSRSKKSKSKSKKQSNPRGRNDPSIVYTYHDDESASRAHSALDAAQSSFDAAVSSRPSASSDSSPTLSTLSTAAEHALPPAHDTADTADTTDSAYYSDYTADAAHEPALPLVDTAAWDAVTYERTWDTYLVELRAWHAAVVNAAAAHTALTSPPAECSSALVQRLMRQHAHQAAEAARLERELMRKQRQRELENEENAARVAREEEEEAAEEVDEAAEAEEAEKAEAADMSAEQRALMHRALNTSATPLNTHVRFDDYEEEQEKPEEQEEQQQHCAQAAGEDDAPDELSSRPPADHVGDGILVSDDSSLSSSSSEKEDDDDDGAAMEVEDEEAAVMTAEQRALVHAALNRDSGGGSSSASSSSLPGSLHIRFDDSDDDTTTTTTTTAGIRIPPPLGAPRLDQGSSNLGSSNLGSSTLPRTPSAAAHSHVSCDDASDVDADVDVDADLAALVAQQTRVYANLGLHHLGSSHVHAGSSAPAWHASSRAAAASAAAATAVEAERDAVDVDEMEEKAETEEEEEVEMEPVEMSAAQVALMRAAWLAPPNTRLVFDDSSDGDGDRDRDGRRSAPRVVAPLATCAEADVTAASAAAAAQDDDEPARAVVEETFAPVYEQDFTFDVNIKYWRQRRRLFNRFDSGCLLDAVGWYSVTAESVAKHNALRCRSGVIIDAFAGCGGNAIQFAFTCERVIAIEIHPERLRLARHNAAVYGVADRIEFICGDFVKLAPFLKADVVFLAPPWGGPEYTCAPMYDLDWMQPCGRDLLRLARGITDNVALCLPRNVNTTQVIELAGAGGLCEIERNNVHNKTKSITAYFGALVAE